MSAEDRSGRAQGWNVTGGSPMILVPSVGSHPVTFCCRSGHEPDCEPCRPQDCPRGILHPSLP